MNQRPSKPEGRSHDRAAFSAHRSRHALVLATLSSAVLAFAMYGMAMDTTTFVVDQLIYLITPWLILTAISRNALFRRQFDSWYPLTPFAWAFAPILSEFIFRLGGVGVAWEIVAIACFRNAAMATALYAWRPRSESISMLIGAFVVFFLTFVWSSDWMYVVSGGYFVALLWWLMTAYWQRVRDTARATRVESLLPVRLIVIGVASLAGLVLLSLLSFGVNETWALLGLSFASGGSSREDEFAQNGVGDGDAMVAAQEQAMSFGPVESELFLDSNMPTLYDMFSDMYGEAKKREQKRYRAVSLDPSDVREIEQRISTSDRNGKEFSTIRRKTATNRKELQDRHQAAMLYVVGEVPLHLAVERFHAFDGREWTNSETEYPPSDFTVVEESDRPWIMLGSQLSSSLDRGNRSHALKFINFKSNRIPAPPHLSAIHIHKVASPDFFQRTPDDSLMMPNREHVPQLTVMRLRSRQVNLSAAREERPYQSFANHENWLRYLPVAGHSSLVHRTADEWTQSSTGGFADVEAIVNHLRRDFVLAPEVAVPGECENSVEWFLQQKRGPDFLFASTAAQLIRCQGYPTRLVSGFYASAENYNQRSGQTSVLATDIHVWLEVCVDGETWIPLEPTPGYQPPRETLSWGEQFAHISVAMLEWFGSNWWLCLLVVVAVGVLSWSRMLWVDWLLTRLMSLARFAGDRRRLQAALLLLEFRSRLAGRPRPRFKTFRQWYLDIGNRVSGELAADLGCFLSGAEQFLYAPESCQGKSLPNAEIAASCTSITSKMTAYRMNSVFRIQKGKV